jgi:hypothetical protein
MKLTERAQTVLVSILKRTLAETDKGITTAGRQLAQLEAWLKGARDRRDKLFELSERLNRPDGVPDDDRKALRELANGAPYGMVRDVMAELEKED